MVLLNTCKFDMKLIKLCYNEQDALDLNVKLEYNRGVAGDLTRVALIARCNGISHT